MSDKKYVSTRGKQRPIDFYDAILQGIASDGGLLVPDFLLSKRQILLEFLFQVKHELFLLLILRQHSHNDLSLLL